MRLSDSAPAAGSRPDQRPDSEARRHDRRAMGQQQKSQQREPAVQSSMAAAFAKLRG
jgi:uncharacterized protein